MDIAYQIAKLWNSDSVPPRSRISLHRSMMLISIPLFTRPVLQARPTHLRICRRHAMTASARVLSVQSHVISGYVGNKAAVFPLQLLGYDVDVLNSCSLTNHTGYKGGAPGVRLTGEDLTAAIEGLDRNGLLSSVTHLLTGFIGTASFLEAVTDAVGKLRARVETPLTYICDPVLGDRGKLYVPTQLIDIYRDRVLALATVVTPNVFELGLLSGVADICSESVAFSACRSLHSRGVALVVVTGVQFRPGQVSLLVSTADGDCFAVDAPYLDAAFTGSGDLTAALLLAWRDRCPGDIRTAARNVAASVAAVLRRTLAAPKRPGNTPLPELRLVQSRDDILVPPLEGVVVREIDD